MGDQVFNLRGPLDLSWEVGFVNWGGEGLSPMGQQLNVNECLNMKLGWLVLLVNTGGYQIGMPLCLTLFLSPLKLLLWLAVCQLLPSRDLLRSHQRSSGCQEG